MSSRNLRPLRPVSNTRRVFTNRQPRRQPSIGRQFGEGVLLLALGAATLAFLSWLPQKNEGLLVVSEAIADLIGGIGQLLEGLLGLTDRDRGRTSVGWRSVGVGFWSDPLVSLAQTHLRHASSQVGFSNAPPSAQASLGRYGRGAKERCTVQSSASVSAPSPSRSKLVKFLLSQGMA